jgi:hypothetical protein
MGKTRSFFNAKLCTARIFYCCGGTILEYRETLPFPQRQHDQNSLAGHLSGAWGWRLAMCRCLRDLRGESGALLCESMASELKKCAWDVYGVPANKLRIFFHYHVSRGAPLARRAFREASRE